MIAGCRQDMHDQPKYIPLRESDFFGDMRSARPLPVGVVARGHLNEDTYLYTGKINGNLGNVFPFPITEQDMKRGQQRYNIYCTPCHSPIGDGNGTVVQRGYKRPPAYNDPKLLQAPVGHYFDVMTNGYGAMPDYSSQISVEDRWRIAAYIKALQLSQRATLADVPPEKRNNLAEPLPMNIQLGSTPPEKVEHSSERGEAK
ncbi:MAG: quinol:cytochrome C oxidoreductase [Acidobacteria bacterium]|nr:MAG: quinol:cytochrome C oxidoreductase [Acidobacteriota bacterium]